MVLDRIQNLNGKITYASKIKKDALAYQAQIGNDQKYKEYVEQFVKDIQCIKYLTETYSLDTSSLSFKSSKRYYKILIDLSKSLVDLNSQPQLEQTRNNHLSLCRQVNSLVYNNVINDKIELLKLLLEISNQDEQMDLSSKIRQLESYKTWKNDLKKFQNLETLLNSVQSQISDLDMSDEVVQFLKAFNNGSVSLSLLNDHIFNWIKSNHLENKFKLSIKAI